MHPEDEPVINHSTGKLLALVRTGLSQAATTPAPKSVDYPDLQTVTTHVEVLSPRGNRTPVLKCHQRLRASFDAFAADPIAFKAG